MAEQKAAEAAQTLLKSFQETNQIITERMTATQERNMKFFQSFFAEGMETLKSQAESARTLMQELGQKTQEQQEAFQQLAQQSMTSYLDFLQAPFSAYQQSVQAAQAATRQAPDAIQKENQYPPMKNKELLNFCGAGDSTQTLHHA